jgi:hypothetical protein
MVGDVQLRGSDLLGVHTHTHTHTHTNTFAYIHAYTYIYVCRGRTTAGI